MKRTWASREFDLLNRVYWRGRLPRYRVIQRKALCNAVGWCNEKTRIILLAPHATQEALRLTLLHEMCHIGTGSGWDHGPKFRRKMQRLVRLGEKELATDIERYDGTEIQKFIEEHGITEEMPFRDALKSDI